MRCSPLTTLTIDSARPAAKLRMHRDCKTSSAPTRRNRNWKAVLAAADELTQLDPEAGTRIA